jgi:phenylalanyl-tRNA synthetase beta subunit
LSGFSGAVIVRQGFKNVALQCQIRGTTYTFTDEHLDQMSKREINDLFNHLGVKRR